MAIKNFVKPESVDEVRNRVEKMYKSGNLVTVTLKKSKTKTETHVVKIEGVYKTFCTVKNTRLNVAFTIQYVDVITKVVELSEITE